MDPLIIHDKGLLTVLDKITSRAHVKENCSLFMDYFCEKYGYQNCLLINEKENIILYSKGKREFIKTIDVRKTYFDDIKLSVNGELPDSVEMQMDLYILKTVVISATLYYNILAVSRSRMQKTQEVNTLMEISRELIFLFEERDILNALIFAIMGQIMVSRSAVYLLHVDGSFKLKIEKGFHDLPETVKDMPVVNTIWNLRNVSPIMQHETVNAMASDGARLLIPMQYQKKTIGFIILTDKMDGTPILESEYDFLFSLATNVAVSLESSKMIKESIEKRRMEKELLVARNIQENILPKIIPSNDVWNIYGMNIPSREVGGDYYYICQINNKLYCAIADVTGKSIPAALLVSTLHAGFKLLAEVNVDIETIVERLNNLIFESTAPEQFITFFLAVFDMDHMDMKYINAGHNPPILIDEAGKTSDLTKGGLLLGIVPNTRFEIGRIPFDKIDSLLMFTDGFSEATNTDGEEFGEERLKTLLIENRKKNSEEIAGIIVDAVSGFKTKSELQDDMTILVVKKK